MRRHLHTLLSTLMILGITATASRATDNDAMLDQLLEKSGLNAQLSQYPPIIQAAAAQAEAQGGGLAPEKRAKMTLAINWAFDEEKLLADLRESLKESLDDNDVQAVLDWLDSPAGRLLTSAEAKSATPEAQMALQSEGQALLEDEARVEIMKRLERATSATEHQMSIMFQMQRAIVIAAAPESAQTADLLQAQFEQNKPLIQPTIERQVLASFLFTYRDIGDEDVEKYSAFAETEAGRTYHEAILTGLNKALVNAGTRMGQRLREMAADPVAP